MSMMVSFVLSFFPRDVLDEILNLIESVSEDFPSYSYIRHPALKTKATKRSNKLIKVQERHARQSDLRALFQTVPELHLLKPATNNTKYFLRIFRFKRLIKQIQ